MVQHWEESYKSENVPPFKFRVVRSFKSALDRQIADKVRIEMKGSLSYRRGEFNMCSLTRLGVDQKWEDQRYKKSLEELEMVNNNIPYVEESRKTGRVEDPVHPVGAKKRKIEKGGMVWGESVNTPQALGQGIFNNNSRPDVVGMRQSTLNILSGNVWMVHQILLELAGQAVEKAWDMECVAEWPEWGLEDILVGEYCVGGTAPDISVSTVQVGQDPPPQTKKRGGAVKKKNKKGLGVTAKQRSAKDFMVVSMENVKTRKKEDFLSSSVLCADDVALQGMTKPEHELERERRLCLVKLLKLEWVSESMKIRSVCLDLVPVSNLEGV